MQWNIQREIQISLAGRRAIRGQQATCSKRLERIRVAEEESRGNFILKVAKFTVPGSGELVIGKTAGVAARKTSRRARGAANGRNQESARATAELLARGVLSIQQLEYDRIDLCT